MKKTLSQSLCYLVVLIFPAWYSYAQQSNGDKPADILKAAGEGDSAVLAEIIKDNPEAWKTKGPSGNQALHIAALNSYKDVVEILLKAGADPNSTGFQNWTALHSAARGGSSRICELLLKHGADPTAKSDLGSEIPLTVAKRSGNYAVVRILELQATSISEHGKQLLKALLGKKLADARNLIETHPGLTKEIISKHKETALHFCAYHGHHELMDLLIKGGADVDAQRNQDGATPLYLAVLNRDSESVRRLLAAKADPNLGSMKLSFANPDFYFSSIAMFVPMNLIQTPVALAALQVKFEPTGDKQDWAKATNEIYETSRQIVSGTEKTPEAIAKAASFFQKIQLPRMMQKIFQSVKTVPYADAAEQTKILKLLIDAGARIETRTDELSPVHAAALNHSPKALALLLEKGRPIDPHSSMLFLKLAALNVDEQNVSLLMQNGVDPFTSKPPSPSGILFAARFGRPALLKTMLDNRKGPSLTSKILGPIMQSTVVLDNVECLGMFVPLLAAAEKREGVKPGEWIGNCAVEAAMTGAPRCMKILLESGVPVGHADDAGFTLLHSASERGHTSIVAMLIESGASVTTISTAGSTPLESAVQGRHVDTVKLLLESGASANRVPKDLENGNKGMFALTLASSSGYLEIVKLLLERGAEVDQFNAGLNRTALHHVAAKRQLYSNPLPLLLQGEEGARELEKMNDELPDAGSPEDYKAIASLLLKAGAKIDRKDSGGHTPLHYAVLASNMEVIKLLIKAGVDPNVTDSGGNTSLHMAAQRGKLDVVKSLIDAGATKSARNQSNKTPLEIAVENGNLQISTYLK